MNRIKYTLFLTIVLISFVQEAFSQSTSAKYKQSDIQLVSNSNQEIIISIKTGIFTLSYNQLNGEQAVSLTMDGAVPILKSGAPEILQISKSIIIPDLAKMKIKVISSSFTDYQNINLLPSKGNLIRNIDPATVPFVKGPEYTKNEFFPKKIAVLQTPYILRYYRAQAIAFYPFQYNPVTKVLRVYDEFKVKITQDQGLGVNPFYRNNINIKKDEEFSEIYKRKFINYSSSKYTAVSESGPMLIIAHQPYMAAMQPFVAWKNRIGRPTEIISVQSIGNNSDSIKNFISSYYAAHGLTYVLLVGDAQYITPKMLTSSTASDNWYGYLSGNDSYPEVLVGRFSAESVADVETQVQRTINYEAYPDPNASYYKKSIGIASSQGPGDDNEYDYQHMRNMHLDLLSYNYQSSSELFDGSQGGNDAAGNPTAAMVANELNDGRGLILYTGHGSTNSFVTSGFNKYNVGQLNNSGKLPFIFAVACVNGNFVGTTCFAESWLRSKNATNQPVGAVATLMSTINQSWNPPMDGQDEMVDILTESYTGNIKRTFAGIAMNGCMHMNDQYSSGGPAMTDTWTCFGDPSLMVRTSTPTAMMVVHQPTLNLGDSIIQIFVNDSNAYVALTIHDSIISTGYINSSVATLHFVPLSTLDTITVAVTSYNKVPYISNIHIVTSPQPYISQNFIGINDSLGNNNSIAEYGENIRLNISLKNMGMTVGNGISSLLFSVDTNVLITDSTAIYGNIAAGDSLLLNNAFAFTLSSSIADQKSISFQLKVADSLGNIWNSPFSILANAPKLTVNTYQFVESSGNGNGTLDAGESFALKVGIKNAGHSDIYNVINTLITSSSYITLQQVSIGTSTLEKDSAQELIFNFTISSSTPLGERVAFVFKTNSGGYEDIMNIDSRVGVVDEDYETGDFMRFNWLLSGNKNWEIDSTTYYDGAHSARSGLTAGDDNMHSMMQLPIKVQKEDSLSFYIKVSSEDGSASGQYWDFLEFKIDNMSLGRWQGEVAWSRKVYPITTGPHLLTWNYSKDQMSSDGSDCAWVDYIVFPPLVDNTIIENTESIISMDIYPNPTRNFLNIVLSNTNYLPAKVKIYNATATFLMVFSNHDLKSSNNHLKINTSDLPSGVYFISVQTKNHSLIRKFIKF